MKEFEEQDKRIKAWMDKIKYKIVVLSGKGGVGKSTVAANLAMGLALKDGRSQVGILDADITGPSIPIMLGARKQQLNMGPPGVFPAIGQLGIKIISMDLFLLDDETPVIWRGPLKSTAIRQFLSDVVWGSLDYLIVDLPPGTGDEALTVMQQIQDVNGVIIVTIPSEVSQHVVKKAVNFTRQLGKPLIGVLENMSGFVCPKCGTVTDVFMSGGGETIAKDLNVPFLGKIPLDQRISAGSDSGLPYIYTRQDFPAAEAFMKVVDKIEEFLRSTGSPQFTNKFEGSEQKPVGT
jgi:ATP-binding protein involved in chromosome partitioning